ncbi:MAG TPA: DUF1549 domain-containing protein [Pirellulales bacterium]|nr:DUF1549 domain-containing protein [Pirellulales bacterium]
MHKQIDALVAKRQAELKITPAAVNSDAKFVRRAYLDLTGVIPTVTQARAFLEDAAADKRQKLIDDLLDSPDYALHMARVFDVMLTERRIAAGGASRDVPQATWRAYLAESFAENKPWDMIVHELLASDGTEEKLAGALKFYLVRDVAPHQLARDVGRLFLGVDLQCAQCHNDPRIDEYLQADYFGIYAFLERIKLHPVTPRGAQLAETAESKTTFVSVFTAESGETAPRLPGGPMLADPELEKGKEYIVKPGSKERSVPAYSRRLKLAEQLPRAQTQGFSRNIANRLWALLLGKGLVHPLDLHHANNPPSHPELLAALQHWLVEHNYDIKGFLREVALSDTYQRSSAAPTNAPQEPPDGAFAVAPLRGLSPEQLRWSLLQATGRTELHYTRLEAQASKAEPMPAAAPEPAWKVKAARNEALERQTASLIAAFAGLPGQAEAGFQPVVDQALYLRNSSKFLPLLQADPGTLLARLNSLTDAGPAAEELYLSVLSRKPTADEAAEVGRLLKAAKTSAERGEALQALLWGLLLSAEFRLNH